MTDIQKPKQIEFVATIDRVKDDVITTKEGKVHKVKVIKYERTGRDGKKEQKTASVLQAYLDKAVALQGKIAGLEPDQKVGIVMQLDANDYYKLKDINLDPDKPMIAKTYANKGTSTGGDTGGDERQASIIAQSSVKAAIDILTNKLKVEDVEAVAKQVQAAVNRLSRGETIKTVTTETVTKDEDLDAVV